MRSERSTAASSDRSPGRERRPRVRGDLGVHRQPRRRQRVHAGVEEQRVGGATEAVAHGLPRRRRRLRGPLVDRHGALRQHRELAVALGDGEVGGAVAEPVGVLAQLGWPRAHGDAAHPGRSGPAGRGAGGGRGRSLADVVVVAVGGAVGDPVGAVHAPPPTATGPSGRGGATGANRARFTTSANRVRSAPSPTSALRRRSRVPSGPTARRGRRAAAPPAAARRPRARPAPRRPARARARRPAAAGRAGRRSNGGCRGR